MNYNNYKKLNVYKGKDFKHHPSSHKNNMKIRVRQERRKLNSIMEEEILNYEISKETGNN